MQYFYLCVRYITLSILCSKFIYILTWYRQTSCVILHRTHISLLFFKTIYLHLCIRLTTHLGFSECATMNTTVLRPLVNPDFNYSGWDCWMTWLLYFYVFLLHLYVHSLWGQILEQACRGQMTTTRVGSLLSLSGP